MVVNEKDIRLKSEAIENENKEILQQNRVLAGDV
jgi:hypothetical protein